ncbi:MAG: sulfotransferase [Sphingomonas bacterium]|nr:sulfotransferase [Sphingomonas bacterium]
MIDRAVRAEGLDDFGGDHWRAPFAILIAALREEAALNSVGRTLAFGQLVKVLRERLRAQALWQAHPEILERPIVAPIVVLGSMRSGTTRIQRLLACDEGFAHTRLFESLSPVPEAGPASVDLRVIKASAGLAFLHALNPALAAIHPSSARSPEEEFGLFSFAFSGAQFQAQWRTPGFARWWEGADVVPVYREFRRLLQTIGWSRGQRADAPWMLKAPQFLEELDALLTVFPDARLLCLGRDAVDVVGSSCSLVWQQQRIQSDAADRHWIGREWLHKTVRRVGAARAVRLAHPEVPQLDIAYAAMDRDWRHEIARIYDFLGLELTPATMRRMERFLSGSKAHRGHRYQIEEFGLSAGEVRRLLPAGA